MVKVNSDIHCSHPTLLCRSHEQRGRMNSWPKLEAIRVLMLRGWRPRHDIHGGSFEEGGSQEFLAQPTLPPKSYFLCLLVAPVIWKKPGAPQQIWHGGTDVYYRELLEQEDLSTLSALSREQMMKLNLEES